MLPQFFIYQYIILTQWYKHYYHNYILKFGIKCTLPRDTCNIYINNTYWLMAVNDNNSPFASCRGTQYLLPLVSHEAIKLNNNSQRGLDFKTERLTVHLLSDSSLIVHQRAPPWIRWLSCCDTLPHWPDPSATNLKTHVPFPHWPELLKQCSEDNL